MSSIEAYDDRARIAKYDADMEVMHPNRGKMADIALDVLACQNPAPRHVLDLGCGTGFIAQRLLERFPNVTITALDGAQNMLDLAASRLKAASAQVRYLRADFRNLASLGLPVSGFDAVFSAYALHHLAANEKQSVLETCHDLLMPGGFFFNADLVKNPSQDFEACIQDLRVRGILDRADAGDERFLDALTTHAYLTQMEQAEGDQPLDLEADLLVFRKAGFSQVSALWVEYREAVIGAQK
jgi:tRNA (cmo5U34)-methyltransferase